MTHWLIKPILLLLCLLPAAHLLWQLISNQLGANPIEALIHQTGIWSLRLLWLTLAITPARQLFQWPQLLRFRRMLGLVTFFYLCLHLCCWLILDQGLIWATILEDVIKRPYISVGFIAFILLVPLALTSTRSAMRRMGKNWLRLHRLIYLSALLALLHFYWRIRADYLEFSLYALLLAILLGFRLWRWQQQQRIA